MADGDASGERRQNDFLLAANCAGLFLNAGCVHVHSIQVQNNINRAMSSICFTLSLHEWPVGNYSIPIIVCGLDQMFAVIRLGTLCAIHALMVSGSTCLT